MLDWVCQIWDVIQINTFWCEAGTGKALCAGLLQARATLFTGFLAFVAAILAYQALNQDRKNRENEYKQKQLAFKYRLKNILIRMPSFFEEWHSSVLTDYELYGAHGNFIALSRIPKSELLTGQQWENHALLSKKFLKEYYELLPLIFSYNEFVELSKNVQYGSDFRRGSNYFNSYDKLVRDILSKIKACKKILVNEEKHF